MQGRTKVELQEQLEAAQAIGDQTEISKIQAELEAILIGGDVAPETKLEAKTSDDVVAAIAPKPSKGLVAFSPMSEFVTKPFTGDPKSHVPEIKHIKVLSYETMTPTSGSNEGRLMTIVNGSIWVRGAKPAGSNTLAMISRVAKSRGGALGVYWNPAGFMTDSELVSLEDKANFIAKSSNEAAAMALATLFS